MSFFLYDMIFLVLFTLFVVVFLYIKRKGLKKEGIMFLYRTKLGLKIIDSIGGKHKKFLNYLSYFVIFCGYALMAASLYLIFQMVYMFAISPELVKAVKIPPIAPLFPYITTVFKADYLPPFYFTYWIVTIVITATVHEFFHGIFARKDNVKIKSTGFAFLGPFIGAFVEPDDKKVDKLKTKDQIAMLSAGSFSNLILTILFFIVLFVFFMVAYTPSGVIFNTYTFGVVNSSGIDQVGKNFMTPIGLNLTEIKIDNKTYYLTEENLKLIKTDSQVIAFDDAPAIRAGVEGVIVSFDGKKVSTNLELSKEISKKKPSETVVIETLFNDTIQSYTVKLGKNPENSSRGYLGIATLKTESKGILGKVREKIIFFKDPNTYYAPKGSSDLVKFVYNLIWWIVLINFSVALFNMLPLGIFDGGKVFYLTMLKLTRSEKAAKIAYSISTWIFIGLFALLTLFWLLSFRN